jgi:spermidine/putrescine-binding protein
MSKKRWLRVFAVLMAIGFVAASCSGSDDDDDSAEDDSTEAGDGEESASPAAECEVGQTDGDLSLFNWSEYIDPELISQFESEYGVSVTESFYDSNEAMQPIITAGGSGHDVIVPSDYMVSVLIDASKEGINSIMPLNWEAIPNRANIHPDFASGLPFDPNGEYTAPYQWGTTGLGVNEAEIGEDVPRTWGLIFDPALVEQYGLSGKFTILNDPRETLGAALKYHGYSLNSTSEEELATATETIKGARDMAAAFDSDQYDELMGSGDSLVAHGYSGNFLVQFDESDNPDDFTYFVPDEGGTRWVDNMAVVNDAPHPCTAHTFINFLLDAENGAALTNWNYYASPNQAAEEFIDPEVLADPIVYPTDTSSLEFIADTGNYETNFSDAFIEAKG